MKQFNIIGAVPYYDEARAACHLLKETVGWPPAFSTYFKIIPHIERMAAALPPKSVLVPVPSHEGKATYTYHLANEVAVEAGRLGKVTRVFDIACSAPRDLFYDAKREGREMDITFELKKPVKDRAKLRQYKEMGFEVIAVDNVVDTGRTASAILSLLDADTISAIGSNYHSH